MEKRSRRLIHPYYTLLSAHILGHQYLQWFLHEAGLVLICILGRCFNLDLDPLCKVNISYHMAIEVGLSVVGHNGYLRTKAEKNSDSEVVLVITEGVTPCQ